MSSIPERSDSQRSYTKGEDEISVRRINRNGKDVEGRVSDVGSLHSESSSMASGDTRDPTQSCALKQFSKHRSSHLRFLAWVAYTRRYSNEAITNDERRTCPLLWCRDVFEDQDKILQHVWNCPELSKGLYYCFHCQKSERMGKFHKRCAGAPSKTERLTNVAKKIFSKLGATSHKNSKQSSSSEGSFTVTSSWKSTDVKDPELFRASPRWDCAIEAQELPDTSIPVEMAADWTAACQELADTSIMDMVRKDLQMDIGNAVDTFQAQENYCGEIFDNYSTKPTIARKPVPQLTLDTSMSPLHCNEWKYPVRTYQPPRQQSRVPTKSRVASLDDVVSPMSPVGNFTSMVTLEVSPTETVASGASFFTDSGYTSATSGGESSQCPSRVPSTKRGWDVAAIPEEHYSSNELVDPVIFPITVSDFESALTESLFSTPSVSRSSSNASAKCNGKNLSLHWNDTASLVQSFSDVLDEHISHTKAKLAAMEVCQTTSELIAMSKSSLVSIGLEVLAGVLEGRHPTSIVGVFAFTHIACACAITLNPDEDPFHVDEWFGDLLDWASGISFERHRQIYTMVASSIWQPNHSFLQDRPCIQSVPSNSSLLLEACRHFLDVLEHTKNSSRRRDEYQSASPAFDFEQMTFELNASSLVSHRLIGMPTIEAFRRDIQHVDAMLCKPGMIRNSRELELELICAAKRSSQSKSAYTRFVNHVTVLCDELRQKESGSILPRTSYHINDIALIKRHIPDELQQYEQHVLDDIEMSFDDQFFDFANASSSDAHIVEGKNEIRQTENYSSSCSQISTPIISTQQDLPELLMSTYLDLPFESKDTNTNQGSSSHFEFGSTASMLTPTTDFTTHTTPASSLDEQFINIIPSIIKSGKSPTNNPTSAGVGDDRYKCHCGFSPSGEEKWKASNLRRHKRTQHPPDSGKKEWRCQWPGCSSVFTRSDNLRSHQKSRGHAVVAAIGTETPQNYTTTQSTMPISIPDGRKSKKQRVDRPAPSIMRS